MSGGERVGTPAGPRRWLSGCAIIAATSLTRGDAPPAGACSKPRGLRMTAQPGDRASSQVPNERIHRRWRSASSRRSPSRAWALLFQMLATGSPPPATVIFSPAFPRTVRCGRTHRSGVRSWWRNRRGSAPSPLRRRRNLAPRPPFPTAAVRRRIPSPSARWK